MFPNKFDYIAPTTVADALNLLQKSGDNARLLAGGQSLIPMMKLRFLAPEYVIDLRYLRELRGIEEMGEQIRCGAMVKHSEIERSQVIAHRIPLLREAGADIADVQVRNRGTLGGALCQADPAGDWAVTALALSAQMRCVNQEGYRMISADEFFLDTYTTALKPDEILVDVFFPVPPEDSDGVYVKIRKRSGDFAIASVALQITRDGNGRCTKVGIGLGGVAPTAISPKPIIEFLLGKELSSAVIKGACGMLRECLDPIDDLRGSVEYKCSVAEVALERAFNRILTKVGHHTDERP